MRINYFQNFKRSILVLGLSFFAILSSACIGNESRDKAPFLMGTMTHFGGHRKGRVTLNMDLVMQAGFNTIRESACWEQWEKEKGVYEIPQMFKDYLDTCYSNGITPLIIFNHGNALYTPGFPQTPDTIKGYTDFAAFLVRYMKGRPVIYQIWNEWFGGCAMAAFKGKGNNAENYFNLLESTYKRIKSIDPNAVVLSNSFCMGLEVVESVLKLKMLHYCDGVAINLYEANAENWVARIKKLDLLLKKYNHGKSFPIYATETGWSIQTTTSINTETSAAENTARLFLLAKTLPAMKGVWYYDFQDDGFDRTDKECNFGLIKADYTPKDSFSCVKSINQLMLNGDFEKRIELEYPDIYALKYKLPDSKTAIAFWTSTKDQEYQLILRRDPAIGSSVELFFAGQSSIIRQWGMQNWAAGKEWKNYDPTALVISIKNRPLILKGNLRGLKISKVIPGYLPLSTQFQTTIKIFQKEKQPLFYNFGINNHYTMINDSPEYSTKDLDASLSAQWDNSNLYVYVNVSDNKFCPKFNGDRIEFSLSNAKEINHHPKTYSVYLKTNTAIINRRLQKEKWEKTSEITATIICKPNNLFSYYVKIPASTLGLDQFQKNTMVLFSLNVYDNDGSQTKGFLHCGNSINIKDSTNLNAAFLLNKGSTKTTATERIEPGWKLPLTDWHLDLKNVTTNFCFGNLHLSHDLSKTPALHFKFKFMNNAVYASIYHELKKPSVPHKIYFNILTKDIYEIGVRLTDETGQIFQYLVPINAATLWSPHCIEIGKTKFQTYWGGANDQTWHGNLKTINFFTSRNRVIHKNNSGEWYLSDVVIAEKR